MPRNVSVVLDSEHLFQKQVDAIPRLSKEEEFRLALEWRGAKNRSAAHKLILANLYIVLSIAHEFKHFHIQKMDLVQEGAIGLMKAVRKFDPKKDVLLRTYASFWIRAEMHDSIIKSWSLVKMGTTKTQLAIFAGLRHDRELLAATEGKDVDIVAAKYNTTADRYRRIANRFLRPDKSADTETDSNGVAILHTFVSDAPTPEEELLAHADISNAKKAVHEALMSLDKRERKIITERHLSDNPQTLSKLADMFGVSLGMVAKIERRAKKKLASHPAIQQINL